MNKSTFSVFLSIVFTIVFLASCSKDPASFDTKTKIRVVHASPNAPAVNLLLNGTNIASGVTFTGTTPYLTTEAGFNVLQVVPVDRNAQALSSLRSTLRDTLISSRDNYLFDFNYTVFAADTVANADSTRRITPIIVFDNLNLPSATALDTTALVRFFHLAPGAPNVTVARVGTDTLATQGLFVNRPFSRTIATSQQIYTSVRPGTYNLVVRQANTLTQVLNVGNVNFEAGKAYTIYARGFSGGQPLSHGVLVYDYKTD
ncbi:MAG: DUF4397 domain-containing protein [Chloroherpetonaceae bacterium]|nr:DUF4397 domain-containing protein [Chloroherpetonaceae bacterium]